ncbi:hypothetical protein QQZ08_000529 [Neonectria magnoliae]|uniref:Uncharacterized protein n=1 Tax=Neonectria magnoliae TaxID=2732573 RepID=A0ABR1IIV7_9HYPO
MLSVAPDIETSISAITENLQAEANESPLVRDMIDDYSKPSLTLRLSWITWGSVPGTPSGQISLKTRYWTLSGFYESMATGLGDSHHDFLGFADFKANGGFPDGIGGLTAKVKAENPLVTTVDVDGKMYYAVHISRKLESISASDLNRFYDDFYAYLASSGITFVKTDI